MPRCCRFAAGDGIIFGSELFGFSFIQHALQETADTATCAAQYAAAQQRAQKLVRIITQQGAKITT